LHSGKKLLYSKENQTHLFIVLFLVYMYKQKERGRSGSLNFGSEKKNPAVVLYSKERAREQANGT